MLLILIYHIVYIFYNSAHLLIVTQLICSTTDVGEEKCPGDECCLDATCDGANCSKLQYVTI